jgi:ribosome-binding protein aMBF1 (putative translation factor)
VTQSSIIAAIIAKRNQSGLRVVDVAKKLDCCEHVVRKMEHGRKNIGLDELVEFAKAVGLKLEVSIKE